MPPFQLGDQPGDAERYDHKGNLFIIKEEPQTSSSESDENAIIEINLQGTANPVPASQEAGKKPRVEGTGIPVLYTKCSAEEKEDKEPVPSTSGNIKKQPSTGATMGPFPGRIEIEYRSRSQFLATWWNQWGLDSLMFIQEALLSLVEDLPGGSTEMLMFCFGFDFDFISTKKSKPCIKKSKLCIR